MNENDFLLKLQQDIENYKTEKKAYENVVKILKNLRNVLKVTKNSLLKVEKNFKEGAYISKNETLDKGFLQADYKKLNDDCETLDLIIINNEKKIALLNNKITSSQKQYNSCLSKINESF